MAFTPEQIANATGAPLANCQVTWPATVAALQWAGIDDHPTHIAAIGTIARETGIFFPIREEGDYQYFLNEFGSAYEAQYFGRGTIQCSWSYNYKHYGDLIGLDLLNNPDLALSQDVAAKVLALYFRDHNVPAMAAAGNWGAVQTAVNGGWIGWSVFINAVGALLGTPEPADGPGHATVATDCALKHWPAHIGPALKTHDGKADFKLKAGTVVTFTGHVTPSWCQVDTPDKYRGWLLRNNLRAGG